MLARFSALVALALTAPANAAMLDLSTYSVSLKVGLGFEEASAVAYNWDRNTLIVVGDEGTISEFSTVGARLTNDVISGYRDTEGLTYIGGGQYVIADERTEELLRIGIVSTETLPGGVIRNTYTPKSQAPSYSLTNFVNVGNSGLEGVSFDPVSGDFFAIKQENPEVVYRARITFGSPTTGTQSELFNPALLGLSTLSDIQVLSTITGAQAAGYGDNLLILSATAERLIEVTRAGQVVSSFNLAGLGLSTIEGVTVDRAGNIYLVSELGGGAASGGDSGLLVLKRATAAVPEPATWAMLIGGFGLAGTALRRRPRATLTI